MGGFWPWEWFQGAQDTTQSILDALVQLTVGGIVMVIGVLILVAWIKLPGGNWVRVVGGAAVTLVGALIIWGYFGGMQ